MVDSRLPIAVKEGANQIAWLARSDQKARAAASSTLQADRLVIASTDLHLYGFHTPKGGPQSRKPDGRRMRLVSTKRHPPRGNGIALAGRAATFSQQQHQPAGGAP